MGTVESLGYFRAELILLAGGVLTLFSDIMFRNKKLIGWLAFAFIVAAAVFMQAPGQPSYALFNGFFTLDAYTCFFRCAVLFVIGISLLLSLSYGKIKDFYAGEYFSLFLFASFGLILMAASSSLLMIFLSIEFVSLISYLLVGYLKENPRSKEASLKYLLFGSVCSAFMLYGMSLLYGITGSLDLEVIRKSIASPEASNLAHFALLMILAGIGFKISMAPFHFWAPDVYEGAPTPVTAFLTVGPKALGFAVLVRFLSTAYGAHIESWNMVFYVLAVLTMTLGNIIAIAQDSVKRLLAYSSIAQAGYILMGVAVFSDTGLQAVLIYVVAYAVTNLGAFAVVLAVSNKEQSDHITSYSGLSARAPWLAAALTIFLLSLAGIPPFAGFIGKLLVFAAAVEAKYYALAIAAAINSVIAAVYYFKIVRVMYLVPVTDREPLAVPILLKSVILLLAVGTLVIGLFPLPIMEAVKDIFPLV